MEIVFIVNAQIMYMIKMNFLIIAFAFIGSQSTYSQEVNDKFKPNIFKYSKDELPVTFGISGGVGPSTGLIGCGVTFNIDICHIFMGYRVFNSPIFTFETSPDIVADYSYYFGYRYRKNKMEMAVGSGFGKTYFRTCKGGDSDGCGISESGTYKSTPIIVEYSYFPLSFAGISSSLNIAISGKNVGVAILTGIKLGIFREHIKAKNQVFPRSSNH